MILIVIDDNIDEDEQSFALIAEIGPDVPDGVSHMFSALIASIDQGPLKSILSTMLVRIL